MSAVVTAVLTGVVIGGPCMVRGIVHAYRTMWDSPVPEKVWDSKEGPWVRRPNGNYRYVAVNSDGILQNWPLRDVDSQFGPITTTAPKPKAEAGAS